MHLNPLGLLTSSRKRLAWLFTAAGNATLLWAFVAAFGWLVALLAALGLALVQLGWWLTVDRRVDLQSNRIYDASGKLLAAGPPGEPLHHGTNTVHGVANVIGRAPDRDAVLDAWLTVSQAAERLGVPESAVHEMIDRFELHALIHTGDMEMRVDPASIR